MAVWYSLIGVLLIVIGLSDTVRRDLPFSTAALYLAVGYALGPNGFEFLDVSLTRDAKLLETLSEAAVLISLFAVGLRLRVPLNDRLWRAPILMATAAMIVTVFLLMALGIGLGLSAGAALLMAGVLAPTDPVLASDVQVDHTQDRDRLRFSLTGEGGLNDGAAFPFVMLALGLLGLHDLGTWGARWWSIDVLWATAAGLGLGFGLGFAFSRLVVYLRREREQALGMESFLAMGLIALTYGIAISVHAYGFLAVFAAGIAMRHVERQDNPKTPTVDLPRETAAADSEVESEETVEGAVRTDAAGQDLTPASVTVLDPKVAVAPETASAYMATAVLAFTLDLERLAELAVMLVVGSLLSAQAFTATSLIVAGSLMFVIRPVAILLTTWGLGLTGSQRRLAAWFGIRGIGSMYYLAYAIAEGADGKQMPVVADAVLVTIALSVLLHGTSATPVMRLYRKARTRRQKARPV